MLRLIPAVLSTSITPYAVAMGAGFLIGAYGHAAKSRLLILTGILIVGVVSAVVAFGVARIA